MSRLPRARAAGRVAVLFFAVAFACSATAAGTYKWTDEQGVVHYSDKAPPETPAKGATILDKQGRPVKKIEPPLTPEQAKAKADEEERQRALQKAKDDQVRKDKALMQSYSSEAEIDIARNRAVSTIEGQIKSAQAYRADLANRQKAIAQQKAAYGKKPMPIEVERESASVDAELSRQGVLIAQKQEELVNASEKYDTIKRRWHEIIADQERAAATAAAADAAAKAAKPAPGRSTTQGPSTTANK
jgi:hypothetical protein